MVDLNKTTWHDMLKDKQLYNEVIIAITKNPVVSYLLKYKKISKYEIILKENKVVTNKEEPIFSDWSPNKIVGHIITKIRDEQVEEFDSRAKTITVNDLICYVCSILSRFIMVDKMVRQKLFTWDTLNNGKTASLISYKNETELYSGYATNLRLELVYKIYDNNLSKYYRGAFYVDFSDCSIFYIDITKKLLAKEFIKMCLETLKLEVKMVYNIPFEGSEKISYGDKTGSLAALPGYVNYSLNRFIDNNTKLRLL